MPTFTMIKLRILILYRITGRSVCITCDGCLFALDGGGCGEGQLLGHGTTHGLTQQTQRTFVNAPSARPVNAAYRLKYRTCVKSCGRDSQQEAGAADAPSRLKSNEGDDPDDSQTMRHGKRLRYEYCCNVG